MKNNKLSLILLITAVIASLAITLKFLSADVFGHIICFPFEQIGVGLRWLSLQGGWSNAIAFAVYVALCLSPILIMLQKNKKHSALENGILIMLSLLLFYVIYLMINPRLIPIPSTAGIGNTFSKAVLCGSVYSLVVTFLVLKVIKLFFSSDEKKLHIFMVQLLCIIAMLFTISIFGAGLNNCVAQIRDIGAANAGNDGGLFLTYLSVAIKFFVDNVANAVSIIVIYCGIALLNETREDPYSMATVAACESLLRVSKAGLIVTVCSSSAFNLLQIIFMRSLRNINTFIQVPLISVVFILGALILSKMIMANKNLKNDNDSII